MSSSTHLYSVDGDGSATPVADGPTGSGPTKPGPTVTPRKARPQGFATPTDRTSHERSVEVVKKFCQLSRNGSQPVGAGDVSKYIDVASSTISLNNGFFVSVGILTQAAKGTYLPTPAALEFQRKASFGDAQAPKSLAPGFKKSWGYDVFVNRVGNETATVAEVVESMAAVAGTDNSYAPQYRLLIQWFEFVGLITVAGDVIRLVEDADVNASIEGNEEQPGEEDPRPKTNQVTPTGTGTTTQTPSRDGAVVSIDLSFALTADELQKLSADQITALFDGIGKVANIKIALSEK